MLTLLLSASALLYLAIGVWAVAAGPMAPDLHRLRWDIRVGAALCEDMRAMDRDAAQPLPRALPSWRLWWVGCAAHVLGVLGWPWLLPGAWRQARELQRQADAYRATRPWQRLVNHGDGGDLACRSCGHVEPLPFVPYHRANAMSSVHVWALPYQCLDCRRLSCVHNNVDARTQRCQCGGVLGRDHITLCPACGSEDLRLHPPYSIV